MPIKNQTKAKEYQRLWIANKRQAQKKLIVEPVEPNKNKYYSANSIKILLSLKDYINLNQVTKKLWLDFNWVFQELTNGIHDIIALMKLREEADILIKDYWQTAKQEIQKGKSWNSLTNKQQSKLIAYWAKQKLRQDKNLLTELEQQEQLSHAYLQEIELQKFHEERGKLKCSCYSCEEKKELQQSIKQKIFGYQTKDKESEKGECANCGKIRKLDEEYGICKTCLQEYE